MHDVMHKRVIRGKATPKNVHQGAPRRRNHAGDHGKNVIKSLCRKQIAQDAVRSRNVSIRFAYKLFVVSESFYHYQPPLDEKNEVVTD